MSPGVAVGRAVLWVSREDSSPKRTLEPEEIESEIERFRRAAEAAARGDRVDGAPREGAASARSTRGSSSAHALFLKDRTFLGPIERRIAHEKVNAEWAVSETTADLMARFRSLPDENFAHRAADIDDVARTLKKHLGGEEYSRAPDGGPRGRGDRPRGGRAHAVRRRAHSARPGRGLRDRARRAHVPRGDPRALLRHSRGRRDPAAPRRGRRGRPRRGGRPRRNRLARAVRGRRRVLPGRGATRKPATRGRSRSAATTASRARGTAPK